MEIAFLNKTIKTDDLRIAFKTTLIAYEVTQRIELKRNTALSNASVYTAKVQTFKIENFGVDAKIPIIENIVLSGI